ncbi:MAG: PBP1A family penicillin-binding protein [Deltaproteobacteria bacterium]|nr:PBP1A family penicillin-binding protein [Deltaproteobacteria bacterium]
MKAETRSIRKKGDTGKKGRGPGKKILMAIVLLFILGAGGISLFLYTIVNELPSIASLKDYRPSIITRVYASKGELIDEFYLEDRKVVRVGELPKFVIMAFVAAEDARFFEHRGVDTKSIARAFIKNLRAGRIVQGGSTITQQVAKSLFLTPEKSYIRKLKEAILAYRIDRYLKKYEILNLYLNQIYLGHGTYGIEAAAQRYFGKQARDLTLAQAALLAGLPKAPSRYSPYNHPERARNRQIYVLNRMAEDGHITDNEKELALNAPVNLKEAREQEKIAPYFTENVRRYIQSKYSSDVLYREGLEVYTTLDIEAQKAARKAVLAGLRELDKRQGYRGALKHIPADRTASFLAEMDDEQGERPLESEEITQALVTGVDSEADEVSLGIGRYKGTMKLEDMSWAREPDPKVAYNTAKVKDPAEVLKAGDVILVRIMDLVEEKPASDAPPVEEPAEKMPLISFRAALEQEPEVQGALLSMEAETGKIRAMVGGRSYRKSEFNRATQAHRQPGSSFKPFIYTAAFDRGFTPSTIIMDTPIIFEDTLRDSTWKPQNYEERFYGPTTLATGLVKSRNLVTIKLLKDIGIDYAADYASNMGIESPLTRDLSMALGSSSLTLLEMVRAYGVFANRGKLVQPYYIERIVDRTGRTIEEQTPRTEQVVDPRITYMTSHLLQEVVSRGTGWRMRALGRPTAGKTGTTNDLKDAWYMGFTPSLVTGVWVGYDDLRQLGKFETGSRAASPITLYYLQDVLAGTAVEYFTPPEGLEFVKIDPETGLLANPDDRKYVYGCYLEGTAPTEYVSEQKRKEQDEFFKLDLDRYRENETGETGEGELLPP